MIGTKPPRRGALWRIALLYVGPALASAAAGAMPYPTLAAEKNPVLLQLATVKLTDAEMAQESGTGLDTFVAVPKGMPPQPKVILWDELHHLQQSGIQTDMGTVTMRLLP